MDAASWMQRRFTEGNAYPTGALPTGLQQSPDTGTARYNLSLSAVNATSFTLQAAPTGTMATDECGTYTVDNFGAKGLQVGGSPVASNSALFARCWGR